MTYEEALEKKNSIGNTFEQDGIKFNVWVTPESSDDFSNFLKNFSLHNQTDEKAKLTCTNNNYLVRGIKYGGNPIVWKVL